ncbi:16650_t:CDS:2 [Funneliformis caledonium]|uniref:16650_t:CDS:1 n=1 Tax=Funneliformis caledonium TaxID=1117310 RepID=A0A9N9AAM1_9GLOM|nr:16650_t:CDS:2 [Funneliformis caledonium]
MSKCNHKKVLTSVNSFCKELMNFKTFEEETILERCIEWYNNFYERYCDLQLTEGPASKRKNILFTKIVGAVTRNDNYKKKRPQDDSDDNKAGPSNEKRSRQEDLSRESTRIYLESYQCEQIELRILEHSIEAEGPPIEWEFSTPKQNWLDKIAQEHQLLTSTNPILWKIIDLFDQRITNLLSKNELSELNTTISASLKNWTILEPMAEKYLYSLAKLDGNQLRIIGEIVRPKGIHSTILELQKILNNIKEKSPEKSDDDLFDDKDTFENDDKNFYEEILLSTEDHTNADVAFIFDLIRFTVFANINFQKHDLRKELRWGREFSLCERTSSKCEDTSKVLSNTLKKLLSITISRFKSIKSRAEKEKFASGKVVIPARQQEHRSSQK